MLNESPTNEANLIKNHIFSIFFILNKKIANSQLEQSIRNKKTKSLCFFIEHEKKSEIGKARHEKAKNKSSISTVYIVELLLRNKKTKKFFLDFFNLDFFPNSPVP